MVQNLDEYSVIETVNSVLQGHCDFIYLLGSAGTPRFHEKSDIDVAVYWSKMPEFQEVSDLTAQLEEAFGRDVDLVGLNQVDPIFARQVIETGRLVFVDPKQKGVLLNWQMQKMSEYPDFKYTRKVVEDNILKRKKYV